MKVYVVCEEYGPPIRVYKTLVEAEKEVEELWDKHSIFELELAEELCAYERDEDPKEP